MELSKLSLMDSSTERDFRRGFRSAQAHLEGIYIINSCIYLRSVDYKTDIVRSSKVSTHCMDFALSDNKKKEFKKVCDHDHTEGCADCSQV